MFALVKRFEKDGNHDDKIPFFPVKESFTSSVGLLTLFFACLAVSVLFNQLRPSYRPSPLVAHEAWISEWVDGRRQERGREEVGTQVVQREKEREREGGGGGDIQEGREKCEREAKRKEDREKRRNGKESYIFMHCKKWVDTV